MGLNKQQIEAVSNLHKEERYIHFISQIVDWEEVWFLDKASYSDNENKYLFLWCAKEYAMNYSSKLDSQYIPAMVTLDEFLETILPDLSYNVEIFATKEDDGKIVTVKELINDIKEEYEKY